MNNIWVEDMGSDLHSYRREDSILREDRENPLKDSKQTTKVFDTMSAMNHANLYFYNFVEPVFYRVNIYFDLFEICRTDSDHKTLT